MDPLRLAAAPAEYAIDAWQRSVLFTDVRRQRGNQYREHLRETAPNVLDFPAEPVMSGMDLPRPVNYSLVRIVADAATPADPRKRPFIVVDPRAGHGPGIGGFKPDSEIGAALKAGHPCYFVGFLPDPVRGQSVEDVMHAEAAFVRKVAELHPEAIGKPCVIGNCQAGWQVLMTAAVWPDLFGPIILAGAPLSYWAGNNPMRYAGGLLGGSWLTAMTSDLGDGRFDGAWLVQNFENLDPANTLWSKQYNLYANVDTEGPRYLGFEKYWGGYVFLEGGEMQYIVDNLFIGNKLATAELCTSEGVRIDLRNIRSPIVVFCSYGDNITPPGQALGWITDLYRDDEDVIGHDQTIVFATHDSIGHLGIFVSGSVGRKEHREFAENIDLIDLLPAGIYRAEVEEHPEVNDPYVMTIRHSDVQEIRAIVQPAPDSERRFAAAARVSEINLALYRSLAQPWVQALSSPESAHWMQALHPLRIGFEWWSNQHPLAAAIAEAARQVRENRHPIDASNSFLQAEAALSQTIEQSLDRYRDHRDKLYATAFDAIYGSPMVQALTGRSIHDDSPARPHPGDSPEHRAFITEQRHRVKAGIDQGGLREAFIRGMAYIYETRNEIDSRRFRHAWNFARAAHRSSGEPPPSMAAFRDLVRRQALLMIHDAPAALAAIPRLLVNEPLDSVRAAADYMTTMAELGGTLSTPERERLRQVMALIKPHGSDQATPSRAPLEKPQALHTRASAAAATARTSAATPQHRTRKPGSGGKKPEKRA